MEIVNLSDLDPSWNWLAKSFKSRTDLNWKHVSAQAQQVPAWLPRRHSLQRASAALATRGLLPAGNSILVSHGPRMSMYGAFANQARRERVTHLAYSFNFTNLPTGLERAAMTRAFNSIDRFVVFSKMERSLYSDYFNLSAEKIDMIHWAVEPPQVPECDRPLVNGEYICAIGSQGRDYKILFEAMDRLPKIKMVLVATADSVAGLRVPANVDIRLQVPLQLVHNIVAKSRFMVLPLAGARVPCGHVTIVSAMHLGKAIVATRSDGIADYIQNQINGLTAIPNNALELAQVIDALYGAPEACLRLGEGGREFARANCVEKNVVGYFEDVYVKSRVQE